ncbi:hypothetical protein G6F57_023806 [Rhizopus arrhizus]|nr:hypothetical protein G6F57_023806 [Rhizopus arrhizus]
MAARHDRRKIVVAPGAAREDVAHLVHSHAEARVAHPSRHQVAALAIQGGQCQAAVAALGRGANLRQVHQRLPQPLPID